MKSCLHVPRMFLPKSPETRWSVLADRFSSDRDYWARVEKAVGEAPSALRLILPEVYFGEDDEARIQEIRATMFRALEEEWIVKLNRGFILTERTLKTGVRRGIVAAIDLEAVSFERGESAPIRPAEEIAPDKVAVYRALRQKTPLELPHAVAFYRDKKNKVIDGLLRENLEEVYDFALIEGGGNLKGYFIPDYIACDVARMLHTRGEPNFVLAEGSDFVAAAKAHWEELKPSLTPEERFGHPARFTLVELVNLCDSAVTLHAVHRLVTEVDAEALCDFLPRRIKCRREGNLLYPNAGAGEINAVLKEFIRANTGKIDYIYSEKTLREKAEREDGVGIAMKALDKEDLFDLLKGGKCLPRGSISIGGDAEARYCTESREISYD